MLIHVMYDDGRFDLVKQQTLDLLLEKQKVTSFKRSGGWAVVGRDPIRQNGRNQDYAGPNRRLA